MHTCRDIAWMSYIAYFKHCSLTSLHSDKRPCFFKTLWEENLFFMKHVENILWVYQTYLLGAIRLKDVPFPHVNTTHVVFWDKILNLLLKHTDLTNSDRKRNGGLMCSVLCFSMIFESKPIKCSHYDAFRLTFKIFFFYHGIFVFGVIYRSVII